MKKMLKLNLGCGSNKIPGFVNIDAEPSCKPDLVLNFIAQRLPYKNDTVDQVVLFHTIEHIPKKHHKDILKEVHRVLKPEGSFLISYPEFLKCVDNWTKNHRGKREFWEATIYGRQLYPSDFHVALMHTPDFKYVLRECGFRNVKSKLEPQESFNTIVQARKGVPFVEYEDMVKKDMESFKITAKVNRSDKTRIKERNSSKSG